MIGAMVLSNNILRMRMKALSYPSYPSYLNYHYPQMLIQTLMRRRQTSIREQRKEVRLAIDFASDTEQARRLKKRWNELRWYSNGGN